MGGFLILGMYYGSIFIEYLSDYIFNDAEMIYRMVLVPVVLLLAAKLIIDLIRGVKGDIETAKDICD